jgi:hypothetical protein
VESGFPISVASGINLKQKASRRRLISMQVTPGLQQSERRGQGVFCIFLRLRRASE